LDIAVQEIQGEKVYTRELPEGSRVKSPRMRTGHHWC